MEALAVQETKSNRRQLKVVSFLSNNSSNTKFTQNFADLSHQATKSQGANILEFKSAKSKLHRKQKDRVRRYNPSTGRFLSEDPIGFRGGDTNLYRYVGNNPIKLNDPMGEISAIQGVYFCIAVGGALIVAYVGDKIIKDAKEALENTSDDQWDELKDVFQNGEKNSTSMNSAPGGGPGGGGPGGGGAGGSLCPEKKKRKPPILRRCRPA